MNLHPNMIEIPWKHQLQEYEDYKDVRARAMLWSMRSGKTKTALDKACYRHLQYGMKGLIITAPNGVHANWVLDQIPKHAWKEVNICSMIWISSESREGIAVGDFDRFNDFSSGLKVFAINPEALLLPRAQSEIKKFLKACGRKNVGFIGDESHIYRRASARRTKIARDLAWQCHWRDILTGTVILNSPFHAYSQFDFLARGALGIYTLGDFKKEYGVFKKTWLRNRHFQTLAYYKNMEELRETLSYWASVVTRDSIEGMPPLLETDRPVYMSPAQTKAYKQMVKETILEIQHKRIQGVVGKGKIMKLQQILGGYIMDKKEVYSIDDEPPRLQAMLEEVQGSLPGKTIIWCQFTEDIRRVMAYLKRHRIKAVEFHGKINQTKRRDSRALFESDPNVKCLVGQTSVGVGYEMTGDGMVQAVIFYSHGDDAIARNQAKERATKINGKTITLVDLYTPGSIEVPMRRSLQKKYSLADLVTGQGLLKALQETSV